MTAQSLAGFGLVGSMLIAACAKPAYQEVEMKDYSPIETPTSQRVEITRLGVFHDGLAYDNKRGIYLIKDRETGKEFIGISGIGITEVGDHQSGKSRFEDER